MNTNKVDIQLKYKDYFDPTFDWYSGELYQNISLFTEEFIDIFQDKIIWVGFCQFTAKHIPIELRMKYRKKLYWQYYETVYYGLTSDDIEQLLKEEHLLKGDLNWDFISRECKLSEKFIIKHKKKVNWHFISEYQKLSDNFKKKYCIPLTYDDFGRNFYKLSIFKQLKYRYELWYEKHILNNLLIK